MVADELDFVIGVDTHRDEHVLAVVRAPAGAVVARRAIGADRRGYREALRFAEQLAAGKRAWAIESTGSYGGWSGPLFERAGRSVLEISRTRRTERRLAAQASDQEERAFIGRE
jgi:transposase